MTETRHVPLSEIHRLEQAWPRSGLDANRVYEFAELYAADGATALPALVGYWWDDGEVMLADGHHRLEAARLAGLSDLPIDIRDVPASDVIEVAFELGLTSCATAARPLTRSEKRSAVQRLLEHGGRSDREIASLVGLSHQTVGRIRTGHVGGPPDQAIGAEVTDAYATATAVDLSRRMVRAMRRICDVRGVTDLVSRRMPQTLAEALVSEFGEDEAFIWARRMAAWTEHAVRQLEKA